MRFWVQMEDGQTETVEDVCGVSVESGHLIVSIAEGSSIGYAKGRWSFYEFVMEDE